MSVKFFLACNKSASLNWSFIGIVTTCMLPFFWVASECTMSVKCPSCSQHFECIMYRDCLFTGYRPLVGSQRMYIQPLQQCLCYFSSVVPRCCSVNVVFSLAIDKGKVDSQWMYDECKVCFRLSASLNGSCTEIVYLHWLSAFFIYVKWRCCRIKIVLLSLPGTQIWRLVRADSRRVMPDYCWFTTG